MQPNLRATCIALFVLSPWIRADGREKRQMVADNLGGPDSSTRLRGLRSR